MDGTKKLATELARTKERLAKTRAALERAEDALKKRHAVMDAAIAQLIVNQDDMIRRANRFEFEIAKLKTHTHA